MHGTFAFYAGIISPFFFNVKTDFLFIDNLPIYFHYLPNGHSFQ